ncbi:MAG TPA: ribosome small subunit-dependent GTPase A [Actinotalea caeni]|uniref:ribosome small subunit-dependent GTPase A n=1 Tax=Actinotalea caeni TaxID=1348467 RepID=UPI002B4B4D9C|nr:ribosome small subunit-dependent GTPase A [Actinotalea caeni]HLV56742.1 ribosome small subunit-dependent GTPase A [Actinotalea caeni]
MWRVSRVDKGVVRLVPDGDVDAPDDGTTVATARDGTLPMTVGDPVVPAVGDRVVLDGDRALVMPRTSELVRDTVGKTSLVQVIAANVDVVVVVEHLEPEPALGRLERMVTIAWRADATPLIVLTKSDLVDDTDHWVAQARAVAPGVDVVAVSATTGEGLDALHAALGEARTLVLVGPSGAGKSTLVNALAGHEVMRTGDVRGDGRGMHTTTHRELVRLPGGRWLIDTPGVRSVGLVATEESVAATFADVEELAQSCRFRDCTHTTEPGCAVVAAVEAGELPERRLESWHTLRREAARQAMRADARLAAARTRQAKTFSRTVRAMKAAGQIHSR